MVIHLENHPHSFIKEGVVVAVLVFDNHDSDLLTVFKEETGADEIVCGCDTGSYGTIDGTWDGNIFKLPSPFPSWIWDEQVNGWQAPVPYPGIFDNQYFWNELTQTWDKIKE